MRIRKSEPVQLVAKTHGYFPASFRWRGRRFDVVAVEKCWTVSGSRRATVVLRALPGRTFRAATVGRGRSMAGHSLAADPVAAATAAICAAALSAAEASA